jgi:hypothetical protein
MNRKIVLTVTGALLAIFGAGWLLAPSAMIAYWHMEPGGDYMGRRYGAFLLGIAATALCASSPRARQAPLIGALVALWPTTVLSLVGALALGLNAWPAFWTELAMAAGLSWALLARAEPAHS